MTPAEFREARTSLGFTQSQLGEILDTAPRTIRKWETGERSPNPIACKVLAWMLQPGRPAEWPDTWKPISTAPTEEQSEFLVFDGVGIWKAWRINGEVLGYEMDGDELPADNYPPLFWTELPAFPQSARM